MTETAHRIQNSKQRPPVRGGRCQTAVSFQLRRQLPLMLETHFLQTLTGKKQKCQSGELSGYSLCRNRSLTFQLPGEPHCHRLCQRLFRQQLQQSLAWKSLLSGLSDGVRECRFSFVSNYGVPAQSRFHVLSPITLAAHRTLEWFLLRVRAHVSFQVLCLGESPRTVVTLPSLTHPVCLPCSRCLSHGQQPQEGLGEDESLQASVYQVRVCRPLAGGAWR